MLKQWGRSPVVLRALGRIAGAYLILVHRTTRFSCEPTDPFLIVAGHFPFIYACWHGHHLLAPLLGIRHQDTSVLVSRSADGTINAEVARMIGLSVIRGSGGRSRLKSAKKGGAAGFLAMLAELEAGRAVAQTADIPRGASRQCGKGVIMLARRSGRPIVCVAAVTRWGFSLPRTWDRTWIPLPFGRGGFAVAEPIYVPPDADDEEIEAARLQVEARLNHAQNRAVELARARGR